MEKLQAKLFEAATKNSITLLHQLLIDDPLILDRALVNRFNETPLHVAAVLGHGDFVQEIVLLKPELVNEVNSQLSSPLHLAAAAGHAGVVKALLHVDNRACSSRDRNELLPLHLAAARGHVEAMKLLLEARPDTAGLAACGGESILHLCVKSYQLEALKLIVKTVVSNVDEFINSRDSDGNTILHLAVAEKQVEIIKFLLSVGALEVNAQNHEGLTALEVLIQSRRDVRDSQIEKLLKNVGNLEDNEQLLKKKQNNNSWNSLMKQHARWLDKKKNTLMVVASLIATMAFQVGVNPPKNLDYPDNPSIDTDNLSIDTSVAPSIDPSFDPITVTYDKCMLFYIVNTMAFMASLTIILLLMSGLPMRRRLFMWILMVITWVAITAIALCYMLVVTVSSSSDFFQDTIGYTMKGCVFTWVGFMALLLVSHTIRMIVKLIKKVRKTWMKRSTSSVAVP